eukprot:TRINITY_DN2644_c0_g1_i1.p1 TRINITY_DN2644_c0_g1~~TRINITY_DN2644_c0_g1_i1.p1  ORF type:complete len:367 (-),score=34.85 TRINITY_DN2644_c0_g1_i1:42-1142(-)
MYSTMLVKELQMPIAKFYSISTIEVSPAEQCSEPPKKRSRRKGEEEWVIGERVTFDTVNDIRECQVFYKLNGGIIVSSPILEVTCMANDFDIKKDSEINYEEMIVNRQLFITVRATMLYRTNIKSTMRLIDPIDHSEYNKVVPVSTEKNIIGEDFPLISGATYEFKIHVENLGVSYSMIIQVPLIVPVDNILWTSLFQTADQITFHYGRSKKVDRGGWTQETDIEGTELTLYKKGAFKCKSTYIPYAYARTETGIIYGGSFTLKRKSANDSVNLRIDLMKRYNRKDQLKPAVTLSPIVSPLDEQVPAPLRLPELVKLIAYHAPYAHLHYRQVCKMWYQLIQPTISGTVTAQSIQIVGLTELPRLKE